MLLPRLITGRLIKRYKRFLADVLLDDGSEITAHCPNTGAMTGCAEPGASVWLSVSDNPKRKYAHTWELVETSQGMVSVNTNRANHLIAEVLQQAVEKRGVLAQQLCGITDIRAEAPIPDGTGRFDFKVDYQSLTQWIEVKSVTLHVTGETGAFPDAVSDRALKHVLALQDRASRGDRAMLIFCAQHCGIERVQLADNIDPEYAAGVRAAHQAGVEIVALGCGTDLHHFVADRVLPVELNLGTGSP
ncbi:MAG: DNA/RNA nuclease SfsA [Pseudomonadota bacterium]